MSNYEIDRQTVEETDVYKKSQAPASPGLYPSLHQPLIPTTPMMPNQLSQQSFFYDSRPVAAGGPTVVIKNSSTGCCCCLKNVCCFICTIILIIVVFSGLMVSLGYTKAKSLFQ